MGGSSKAGPRGSSVGLGLGLRLGRVTDVGKPFYMNRLQATHSPCRLRFALFSGQKVEYIAIAVDEIFLAGQLEAARGAIQAFGPGVGDNGRGVFVLDEIGAHFCTTLLAC